MQASWRRRRSSRLDESRRLEKSASGCGARRWSGPCPGPASAIPSPRDLARRERVLGWLERLADDREWFIQKAIGWWLRDLSKHDPQRVRDWLGAHGARLKPFARREAGRLDQPE